MLRASSRSALGQGTADVGIGVDLLHVALPGLWRDVGIMMVQQEHVPRIPWHAVTLGLFVPVAVQGDDRFLAATYIYTGICRIANQSENLAVTGRDPFDLAPVAAVLHHRQLELFIEQMQV